MKKVLLCSPYKGADVKNPGGIDIWAQNIYNYYKCVNTDVKLIVYPCNRSNYIHEITSKVTRAYYGIKDYIKILKGINSSIKKEKIDVVHICSTSSWSLLKDMVAIREAHRNGAKAVVHFHFGRIPELSETKTWEWRLLNKVCSMADKVIVIDKFSYDTLIKYGYTNVVEIPNPLSPQVDQYIKTHSKNINRVSNRLLFVGRVFRKKGVYELVEACKKVPNIELRIVGHVEESVKNDLLSIADNQPWLNIVGPVVLEDVIKELLACDIFVFPTYTEGFPNGIIESMACSCPIIASGVGAIPEMLNEGVDSCGICIKPHSIEEITNAVNSLIGNENLKSELSKKAHDRIYSLYNIENVWRMFEQTWLEC